LVRLTMPRPLARKLELLAVCVPLVVLLVLSRLFVGAFLG